VNGTDGIESYRAAKSRAALVSCLFPVASLRDVIRSKRAANRREDRELLPRLEASADWLEGNPPAG